MPRPAHPPAARLLWTLATAAALSAGCTLTVDAPPASVTPRAEANDTAPREVDAPDVDAPVAVPRALPSSLTCASDALVEHDSTILRAALWLGAEASGTVSFGPAFLWRLDATEPLPVEQTTVTDLRVHEDADGSHVTSSAGSLDVHLQGAFWTGTFTVDDALRPHVIAGAPAALPVVCWDIAEVLGNAWSGEPGLLPARFDWESGSCRDASGALALNTLPLPFVRETGVGTCGDLRGAALNGADYTMPQLYGFDLSGADLTDAQLFFADLRGAYLVGARLEGLAYGYATIEGMVDERTSLPSEGCEVTEGDFGDTVLCLR